MKVTGVITSRLFVLLAARTVFAISQYPSVIPSGLVSRFLFYTISRLPTSELVPGSDKTDCRSYDCMADHVRGRGPRRVIWQTHHNYHPRSITMTEY